MTSDLIFYVLDNDLSTIGVIDNYKSVIWTERFYSNGDFEIYCPNTRENNVALRVPFAVNRYVMRADDPTKLGILTKVQYVHDADNGDMIIAKGYTDDYILHSRIFYEQSTYNGNIEYAVRHIIKNAMINTDNPAMSARNISAMVLGPWVGLTAEVSLQYQGQYLDDEISKLAAEHGFGWLVLYNPSMKQFSFNLKKSVDRSLEQYTNEPVVFSASMDNLTKSEYDCNIVPNIAYAVGSGDGVDRYVRSYHYGTAPTGLDRREYYVDASKTSNNGEALNKLTYRTILTAQARRGLTIQQNGCESVQGDILPNTNYELGVDYDLGDIVQVIVTSGDARVVGVSNVRSFRQRVIEVIEAYDENGYSCIPTFETVD